MALPAHLEFIRSKRTLALGFALAVAIFSFYHRVTEDTEKIRTKSIGRNPDPFLRSRSQGIAALILVPIVIPAQAGIQKRYAFPFPISLDSRLRGNERCERIRSCLSKTGFR